MCRRIVGAGGQSLGHTGTKLAREPTSEPMKLRKVTDVERKAQGLCEHLLGRHCATVHLPDLSWLRQNALGPVEEVQQRLRNHFVDGSIRKAGHIHTVWAAAPKTVHVLDGLSVAEGRNPEATAFRQHAATNRRQPAVPREGHAGEHVLADQHVAHPLRDDHVNQRSGPTIGLPQQRVDSLSHILHAAAEHGDPLREPVALDDRPRACCHRRTGLHGDHAPGARLSGEDGEHARAAANVQHHLAGADGKDRSLKSLCARRILQHHPVRGQLPVGPEVGRVCV
mmetsp:Transcript_43723/g.140239  ORF Transcript_43723/g.140239 Transcript_43723/m.140239 type:complete len:282 (-) Transcript_43723:99-944(-)